MFGSDSKMDEDVFRARCGLSENSWIFNPDLLRKKLAAKAGLDEDLW